MSDFDELAADSSPVSEQSACDATLRDDPSTLTAGLEALLDQIDAEESELVRGPIMVEAVLSARSAVAQWNLLQARSAAIVEDPVTDKLNGLVTRLLRLPGAPRGLALKDIGPVVRQVHPERHLDGVEELKAAYARHVEALKILTSMNGRLSTAVGPNGAQMLVDEALHRLEIERISQARDPLSLVKQDEPVRVDPLLPPWLLTIDQIRQGPPIDWAHVADSEVWPRLSARDRAEAVNDLVRGVVNCTPEKADRLRPSDLVSAANGDVDSWERLRFVASAASSWASTLDPSRSVVPRFVFASRGDLTPEQRGNRDFLLDKLDEIDQQRRTLGIDDTLDELFPGDSRHDRQTVLARQAARRELDELQRDTESALQEYSVLPRRSMIGSSTPDPATAASSAPTVTLGSSSSNQSAAHAAGATPAMGAEVSHELSFDVLPRVTYEAPRRGRFKTQQQFLHEVGWILAKLDRTSEFPSRETVSDWFGRDGHVNDASDSALKGAARAWFGGSWPAVRAAASKHNQACATGPSCVPPEALK